MRRIAGIYLLCVGLTALLIAAAPVARAQDASPAAPATPAPTTPAKPVPPKSAPPRTTVKKTEPAHPAPKVAAHPAKPTAPVKKIATAPKKSTTPARVAAAPKKLTPERIATAAPKQTEPVTSYTITTTRDNVTYRTTRVVPTAGAAAPGPQQVASAPATPPPAEHPAPQPSSPPAAATLTPPPTSPPAGAAPPAISPKPAAAFVSRFLADAFNIARETGASSMQRRAQLSELFATHMDIPRIAGYTTGDELATAPAEVRRRFNAILISYLVETYYPRIELASDPAVSVQTMPAPQLADGTAAVWTTFNKSGWSPQTVRWHLQQSGDGFKIVDIFSAGASLVQMEHDTFVSVMRSGGLPELMAKLDARTKALASAGP
jgi:ABC-type transporter MlaC component